MNATMPNINWLTRSDHRDVLLIDYLSFGLDEGPQPFIEADLCDLLRQRAVRGMAIETRECPTIAGYMLYHLHLRSITLLRLAVHPQYRRMGYGRDMLRRLESRLGMTGTLKREVTIDVPGHLLHAHLWLKACGWRAAPLLGEDAYRFTYRR